MRTGRRRRAPLVECSTCCTLFAPSVTGRDCPICHAALCERLEAERAEQTAAAERLLGAQALSGVGE